jgi:hypothetical protein
MMSMDIIQITVTINIRANMIKINKTIHKDIMNKIPIMIIRKNKITATINMKKSMFLTNPKNFINTINSITYLIYIILS